MPDARCRHDAHGGADINNVGERECEAFLWEHQLFEVMRAAKLPRNSNDRTHHGNNGDGHIRSRRLDWMACTADVVGRVTGVETTQPVADGIDHAMVTIHLDPPAAMQPASAGKRTRVDIDVARRGDYVNKGQKVWQSAGGVRTRAWPMSHGLLSKSLLARYGTLGWYKSGRN